MKSRINSLLMLAMLSSRATGAIALLVFLLSLLSSDHVRQPIVGNYFRNSAQDYTVLDFLSARSERQTEAIRATGTAKAEAYRLGERSLGSQPYTLMQLMQIVGDRNVRIVPDVSVSGAKANPGVVDGLLGLMLRTQGKPGLSPFSGMPNPAGLGLK